VQLYPKVTHASLVCSLAYRSLSPALTYACVMARSRLWGRGPTHADDRRHPIGIGASRERTERSMKGLRSRPDPSIGVSLSNYTPVRDAGSIKKLSSMFSQCEARSRRSGRKFRVDARRSSTAEAKSFFPETEHQHGRAGNSTDQRRKTAVPPFAFRRAWGILNSVLSQVTHHPHL
jgi:hypothetical protein